MKNFPAWLFPDTEEGIKKLSVVVGLFSTNFFARRIDPDYASRMQTYLTELIEILKGMGSFWQPPQE
jgi:hypothetical protein